jgi:hypothetical protein
MQIAGTRTASIDRKAVDRDAVIALTESIFSDCAS